MGVDIDVNGMASDGYSFEHQLSKVNTYELAHKCKEWAFSKGYRLVSYLYEPDEFVCDLRNLLDQDLFTYNRNTEPEAIFAACQWILNNTKAK